MALVKYSAELLGGRSLMRDFGIESGGVIYADSSAALAIAKRKGAGKLRHININCLWIQEKPDTKQLELRDVFGGREPSRNDDQAPPAPVSGQLYGSSEPVSSSRAGQGRTGRPRQQ
ncbi:hypothetical protein N9L68_04790 [bacterium]|nr:hypothetical protein [bacterium]